jgi:RNA-directed DNA polymerase
MTQVPITMRKNAKLFFRPFPALDPSPVIPSDLSFGYLSVELKSPVKIPILDMRDTGQGMVASGGLSPLLGALYLTPLDRRMDRLCKGKRLVHYVRYMDDIVLLARTRWELRRDIAALHEEIATLGLHLHRIKRFIGRTTQGFDFLGYQIRAGARLRPSAEGLRRLRERARQLYEREGDWQRLRQYVVRWWRWHLGGLDGMVRWRGGVKRTWHHVCTHLAGKHPPG